MGLAPQTANPGTQGQNARYDVSGLSRRSDGRLTDGTYTYDDNGLSWDRPDTVVAGLKRANDNDEGGGGGTYNSAIPGSAMYAQAALLAKRAYQNALARLQNKRSAAFRQAGYLADVNGDTGVISNLRVDPNNPFGQYQGLRRSHAYGLQDAEDALMERGITGRGGLGAGLVNRLRQGYAAEDSAFGQNLATQVAGFQDEHSQAKYEYDQALYLAQLAAAREAIGSGAYNEPDYEEPKQGPVTGIYTPPKAIAPVQVNGQWHGAWGPAPTTQMKRIIKTAASVKPTPVKTVYRSSSPYATGQYR